MMLDLVLSIAALLLLILLSAFLATAESAYSPAFRMRVRSRADESEGREDRTILFLYDHIDRTMETLWLSRGLLDTAAAILAVSLGFRLFGLPGAWYAALILLVLLLLFADTLPRAIASRRPERFARSTCYPLRALMWLLTPVVWLLGGIVRLIARLWSDRSEPALSVTEDELVNMVETGEDEGVLDEDRSELIQSAIEFSDITAQEIATPRVKMLAIDVEEDLEEVLRIADRSPFSRIPVYEGSIDNIIGVLSLNHLYKRMVDNRNLSLRDLLLDPCFVHKSMRLPSVLNELRQMQSHLAVVTDEYGGTFGILTMEDALEELVGDIWDETDEVTQEFVEIGDHLYEVDGNLGIYDFLESVGVDERKFDGEFTTVGSWAIEMFDGMPDAGDAFTFENLIVTVHKVDEKRIISLIVEVLPSKDAEDED